MPGRVEGKVAFITGAARGMGRSHAVRLAEEGADIIAVDLCGPVDSVSPEYYRAATAEDLAETVRRVEKLDRRIVARQADVRDAAALGRALDEGVAEFGRLDAVVANAGVVTFATDTPGLDERTWQDHLDVNLTGVWHTIKVGVPHLLATGRGGSVTVVSSLAGLKGVGNLGAYTASKHGVAGLVKVLVGELGPQGIRVNTVHPNCIDTDMLRGEKIFRLFRPDLEQPTFEDLEPAIATMNAYRMGAIEPVHVSNAVLYLVSDEAAYVSGTQLTIDAGASVI
jgi:SDR family mycofactocin-dependent oxidoreductase